MTGWLAALATLAKPVASRVMIALGMSLVTVTGVGASLSVLHGLIVTSIGGLPAAVLGLAGLFGVWEALGIMLGAGAWCLSFYLLTQSTKMLGIGGGS